MLFLDTSMKILWLPLSVIVLAVGCKSADPTPTTTATAGKGFAAVTQLLNTNCVGCHGEQRGAGDIHLTSFDGIMKGGEHGPIVVAGDPANSTIIKALKGQGARQMPPRGTPLPADQIKVVEDWIKDGAKQS